MEIQKEELLRKKNRLNFGRSNFNLEWKFPEIKQANGVHLTQELAGWN